MKVQYEGPEYPIRVLAIEIATVRFQVERWRWHEGYVFKVFRLGDWKRKIDFKIEFRANPKRVSRFRRPR